MERISGGKSCVLRASRVRRDGWTMKRRKQFLDMLATTCNVTRSAQAAGVSTNAAYQLRRKDATFAALWQEAMVMGYQHLEEALLSLALTGVNAVTIEPIAGVSVLSEDMAKNIQLALALLNRHRATAEGRATPRHGQTKPTCEQTDALLRKKLQSLARRIKAQQ